MRKLLCKALALGTAGLLAGPAYGSSHREAPFITKHPKVDATDFYMFRSYEPDRAAFVTIIANYVPLQDAYGGPNYFTMDDQALYEIHVDNNGDAKEDITFQFRFKNNFKNIKLPIGTGANQKMVSIPIINPFPVPGADPAAVDAQGSPVNVTETYSVKIVRGNRRTGQKADVTHATTNSTTFRKPVDYIGTNTFPNYESYAAAHVYPITIPGCSATGGKVFVGQRKDPFAINLGQVFDRVNIANPIAGVGNDSVGSQIEDKNVTTLALEIPIACLTAGTDPVIGGWTTASLRQARVLNPDARYAVPSKEGGAWVQVSRLGMPLVNEVIIGIQDKDKFNGSKPENDGQFADYVTHPILPAYIELLFGAAGVRAPTAIPRNDLVVAFLTGVEGVNKPANVTASEMLRLNTAIPPTSRANQHDLGVGAALCFVNGALNTNNAGCDPAGFPNGRRPGDDVTDIALNVAMGYLVPGTTGPAATAAFTDGANQNARQFDNAFPYLRAPTPGASRVVD